MSASASTRFKWSAGSIFGSAVGAAAWMPATAFTSAWPSRGISLAFAAASLILISAYLLWQYRQKISAFCGLLSLLSVGFMATLIFLLGAHVLGLSLLDQWPGGRRLSPLSCLWVLLLYPALAIWFWFENRNASTSEPSAPPKDGPGAQEVLGAKLNGYRDAQVLMVAERLGLFTVLGTERRSLAELVSQLQASPRGLRLLCDALVALGFLVKQDQTYANSELARECLLPGQPMSQNALVRHAARLYERWGRLYDAVKSGQPVDESTIDPRLQGHEVEFARAMASSGAVHAREVADKLDLSQVRQLLDVGGGPGVYALEFARRFPQLQIVLLDRPATARFARTNIEQAGFNRQIHVRAADVLEDPWEGPYDFIFLSNVIHAWSARENAVVMKKAAAALVPGGRLAIKDFIVHEDHTGPAWACLFALNMLVNTPGGECYSAEEIRDWFQPAGLVSLAEIDLAPPSRLLLAQK